MDINEDPKAVAQRDAYHREMERRSLDMFMVYNPTNEDYMLEWDRRYFRIPNCNKDMGFGKGKMELERYLTQKYAQEMKDKIINEMGKREGEQMLADRKKQGHPDFRDKYIENVEVWNRVIKTDNPEETARIYGEVILGLVREYGIDEVPEQKGESMDTRTLEQKTFDNMNKRYEEPRPIQQPIPVNTVSKKVKLEEVTNETT